MRAFEGDRRIWAEELENRNVFQVDSSRLEQKRSQDSPKEEFEANESNRQQEEVDKRSQHTGP